VPRERLFADHGAPIAFHCRIVRGNELCGDHALDFISWANADERANYDTHPPSIASVAAPARGIPPLFKADTVNIAVSASKDGKLRVVYGGWDDAKVVLPNEVLELRWGKQGVEARIIPRRQGKR
jgi:hypothetical protein